MKKHLKASIFAACSALLFSNQASAEGSFENYVKAGFPGVGAGVGYNFNEKFTARVDFTTLGSISRNLTEDDISYDAKIKANFGNIMLDFFPTTTAFRVTAGLGFNQTQLDATGKPLSSNGTIKINGINYDYTQNDSVEAKVKYPTTIPYLGIGYGHNAQVQDKGFGFIFDLGVYFGKPKTTLNISDSLRQTMRNTGRTDAQINVDINAERDKISKDADKLKVLPVVSLGIVYHY